MIRTGKRPLFMLLALAGALALLGAAALQASASATAVVSVLPPSQIVQPGDSVNVDVAVSGVTDLGAWEVRLKYDPTLLAFQSFTETPWMTSTGRQITCPEGEVDDVKGTVLQGCGSIGATPPGPTGDGVLGRFTFTTKAAGTSNLVFTKISLANPEGSDCCGVFGIDEGAVRIGSGAMPPTPTPDPVKLTPEAIDAPRGDYFVLTPVARTAGARASAEDAATPRSGVTSGDEAQAGTQAELRGSGVAGATADIFSPQAGVQRSGAGAPIAGTGSGNTVSSAAAVATMAALGFAGVMCFVLSGVGRMRSRGVRRDTAGGSKG